MKKIAKVTLIMITVLASLCLTGCGKYVSSWSASAYVHTNTSSYAYMDFWTFKGTQVHTLKCKNETGTLNYSGKLEKGNVIVWREEKENTILYISGYFDKEALIDMAESVKKQK